MEGAIRVRQGPVDHQATIKHIKYLYAGWLPPDAFTGAPPAAPQIQLQVLLYFLNFFKNRLPFYFLNQKNLKNRNNSLTI